MGGLILFRFCARGFGGRLMLQDFYARLKELHAGRGFASPQAASRAGLTSVEPDVDLVEKEGLLKLFRHI
jgi:hypothetical protein